MRRALLLLLITLSWTVPSLGQGSSAASSDSERARTLGHEALLHFAAGRFREALAGFEQADALAHSPVFLLYEARATKELGQLIEARTLYETCVREGLGDGAPQAWIRAKGDAERELRELHLLIPALRVELLGEVTWPVLLSFQGREVSVSPPKAAPDGSHSSRFLLEGNPGISQLIARDQAGTTIEVTVALRVAERALNVPLHFPARSFSTPVSNAADEGERSPREAAGRDPALRLGAWTAFSVGGAALLSAGVFGGLALSRVKAIQERCLGTDCLPEDAPKADTARRFANLATAGFVVGLVGAATGVTLLVWPLPGEDAAGDRALRVTTALDGVSLRGSF